MKNVELGRVVSTRNALDKVPQEEIVKALHRHKTGDWGDVPAEDREANDEAYAAEDRLLSSYKTSDGTVFWILTEADRSVTTVLLPEDY